MEYQALYRKYRPQRFDEIVGQPHVTLTLAREILDGKVAHAYLFAGPRGTGKTTTARVLAKSLNCTNPGSDGEPCNECASCVAVTEGSSLDVIELDAASHNKVEDIREIRMNVSTVAAASGSKRLYILDEAHMLSRAAGNALLKTLEEPPEHVIFVLATTEPYKLLDTIRSRSQRFDFHPVSSETLVKHLEDIAGREGFTTDPQAVTMVSRHAKGSVRDAMSLLEQVAALGGGKVDVAGVSRALGLADREAFDRLFRAIAGQDAPAALGLVAELAGKGADLRRFVADAVGFLRGVFLAQYAPNLEEVVDEPKDVLDDWRSLAEIMPAADVLRSVDGLAEVLAQLRSGREERLVIELALLRLTRPETAFDGASIASRLQRLEERVRRMGDPPRPGDPPTASDPPRAGDALRPEPAVAAAAAKESPQEAEVSDAPFAATEPTESPQATALAAPAIEPEIEPAAPAVFDLDQFAAIWPAIVAGVREEAGPRRHALVREASPTGLESNEVTLTVPAHKLFHLEQLQADKELQELVAALAGRHLDGAVQVRFRAGEAEPDQASFETFRAPDKAHLAEDASGSEDPEDILKDMLGGEELE
jgi:DNA polymerase-3 subunit gamma/tau